MKHREFNFLGPGEHQSSIFECSGVEVVDMCSVAPLPPGAELVDHENALEKLVHKARDLRPARTDSLHNIVLTTPSNITA